MLIPKPLEAMWRPESNKPSSDRNKAPLFILFMVIAILAYLINENMEEEARQNQIKQEQAIAFNIQREKAESERQTLRLEAERVKKEKASTPVPTIKILSGTGNLWSATTYKLAFSMENATDVTVNGERVATQSWTTFGSDIPLVSPQTTIDIVASNTYYSARTTFAIIRNKTEHEIKEGARLREETENKAMLEELYSTAKNASMPSDFADKTVKWFAYLGLNKRDSIAGAVTAMQLFYLSRFDRLNTEEEKDFFLSRESGGEFMTRTAFLLVKLRWLEGHEDFKKLWDYIVGCQNAVNQRAFNEVSLWNTIRYLDTATEGIGDNEIKGTAAEYLWISALFYVKLLNGH